MLLSYGVSPFGCLSGTVVKYWLPEWSYSSYCIAYWLVIMSSVCSLEYQECLALLLGWNGSYKLLILF